jgi:ribonuclease HI/transposase InsO family protein
MFIWTPQADAAFHELKKMLVSAPILASPLSKEPMLLYIAATNRVVSAVIVVEREEEGKPVQRPVYYLSEVLSSSKQNYPHYQKMTYGVYMAAKKLKHYFQEHPMRVICAAPISEIIGNKDASGRIAKWAIELAPYTPQYERRDAIKSQALADFLVDWAEMQYEPPLSDSNYWRMHFDGSKMKNGLGAGIVLTSPKRDQLKYVLQIHFAASNNVAEYEALVHGLKVAKEIGIRRIQCFGDSDLVIQQASGTWDALDANMALYRFYVQQISGYFDGCEFHHVPRAENEAADTLSKLGSSRQAIPAGISLEHLRKPSIKPSPESESIYIPANPEPDVVPMDVDVGNNSSISGTSKFISGTSQPMSAEAMSVEPMMIDEAVFTVRTVPSWAQPIMSYMVDGSLPTDEISARQVQRRAKAYTIINGELYKRSATSVLQRCVEPEEGQEILRDIHQGECGHHASSRALVAKAFRHGFYWPSALQEAEDMVKKCNGCQRYASKIHMPASALKTIPITWPFAVWCLDMVGPFRPARGNMTHILVMVDKFTKWIEVKPIRKCDGHTAVSFLKDIILRYGYPHSIITDNGTNFAEGAFARFCMEKRIRLDVASVAHPESNGQVERANALVLSGIKPRLIEPLQRTPGCWLDELPAVLWSLRTTPNRSTGYTPFFLVYGAEAVLPADIQHDSPRVALYTEAEVKESRENDVDLLEEARELTLSRSAIYQQNLRRYHSRKINPRVFREGDLVLRLVQRTAGMHKLSPPWEGPFIVSKALHNDAYYLIDAQEPVKDKVDRSGEETKRPWNVALLRPFYT